MVHFNPARAIRTPWRGFVPREPGMGYVRWGAGLMQNREWQSVGGKVGATSNRLENPSPSG